MSIFGDSVDEYNCAPEGERQHMRPTYKCPFPPEGPRFHLLHIGVQSNEWFLNFPLRHWMRVYGIVPKERDWLVLVEQMDQISRCRKTEHRNYLCHFVSADWAVLLSLDASSPDRLLEREVSIPFGSSYKWRPPTHRTTAFDGDFVGRAIYGKTFSFEQPDYVSLLECLKICRFPRGIAKTLRFNAPAYSRQVEDNGERLVLSRFLFRFITRFHCRLLAEMMCGLPFQYILASARQFGSLMLTLHGHAFHFRDDSFRYKHTQWALFFRIMSRPHWAVSVRGDLHYTKIIGETACFLPRGHAVREDQVIFMPHIPSEAWHNLLCENGFVRPEGHEKWQAWRAPRLLGIRPVWNTYLDYVVVLFSFRLPDLILQCILPFVAPWLDLLTAEEMTLIASGVNASANRVFSKRV